MASRRAQDVDARVRGPARETRVLIAQGRGDWRSRLWLPPLPSRMPDPFWDDRYAKPDIYGTAPNEFLAQNATLFPPRGRALDLGAGQGRNALFLASRGLQTLAVDQSEVGLRSARAAARARNLPLETQAADLNDFDSPPESFDVISSIFVHLPGALRRRVHARVAAWLKPGGLFILEAYAPEQLRRDTGGPKDPALLASLETILAELNTPPGPLTIEHQARLSRVVAEGAFHTGEAEVVQVVARKR